MISQVERNVFACNNIFLASEAAHTLVETENMFKDRNQFVHPLRLIFPSTPT